MYSRHHIIGYTWVHRRKKIIKKYNDVNVLRDGAFDDDKYSF